MNEADEQNNLSPLKRALLALKDMRSKLDGLERAKTEPIAIIGMGCRFPGQADSIAAYWQMLRDGVHAVREVPPERWDADAFYDPNPDASGKMNTRWGGFIDQKIDQFDAQFFGIAPREAVRLDPQQRLLLEVSWEALEHAGVAPDQLQGSQTGVFVGISNNEYQMAQKQIEGMDWADAYVGTGGAQSVAVGRIAYVLGLHGPVMAIDTACSSSLVAVHQGCQSLRLGQADLALAGGVNVLLSPDGTVALSKVRAISPDSRCKTFDAAADGYVRGEGCGIVVLKRLSDAIADGDNVLAVIRGSAINHDGRSSGLTVPSAAAQQAVIRAALADSGLEPQDISYAEAHGTGTPLGDPIEVRALATALGSGRTKDQPLLLGAVKTNIGHLESAAGVSGLIKLVLCLQQRMIAPHLHFHTPNPHIEWDELPVKVVTKLTAWESDGPRRACLNSFGFSGTNAHIIVEEAPERRSIIPAVERPLHVLALSAKNEQALRDLAERYAEQLVDTPADSLANVCYTAAVGRSHFAHRLALPVTGHVQAQVALSAFANGQPRAGVRAGTAARPRVAFLFTGQGAQYPGMARELFATQPVFRAALERCAMILEPHLDHGLLDVLFVEPPLQLGDAALINQTAYTQPALFAVEYALAELWRSWGVTPHAFLGHSVGEYVAAVLAGVFSLEDGLRLIAARGRLMQQLPIGGAMAAVFVAPGQVQAAIAPYADEIAIAAFNGPEHTVISGSEPAVSAVIDMFAAGGARVQRLTVSHAFHSPLMEPMLAAFAQVAETVTYHQPRMPLIANVYGTSATAEVATAAYWVQHVRAPVQFADGIAALHGLGCDTFLEIGPHPVLGAMGAACLPTGYGTWLPSLRRGRDEWPQILDTLAALYVAGATVDWASFDAPYIRHKLALPTYPFQRSRYWFDQISQAQVRRPGPTAAVNGLHPLLGRPSRSPLIKQILFETTISAAQPAYLNDHRIYGTAIFPGAGYFEMALAAAATLGDAPRTIQSLTIQEPMQFAEQDPRTLQLILHPAVQGAASIQIVSFDGATTEPTTWQTHATGTIQAGTADATPAPVDLAALTDTYLDEFDLTDYYAQIEELGVEYGPAFRGLVQVRRRMSAALGQITLPQAAQDSKHYLVHPVLLDACFQLIGAALPPEIANDVNTMYAPIEIEGMRVYRPAPDTVWCEVHIDTENAAGAETIIGQLRLIDPAGDVIADLERLVLKRAPRMAWKRPNQANVDSWLYQRAWQSQPQANEPAPLPDGNWLIYADQRGVGAAIAARLRTAGATCVIVAPGETTIALDDDAWQIDPTDASAPARLLAKAFGDTPLRGVVYLWGADSSPVTTELADLRAAHAFTCGGALTLIQALAHRGGTPPSLWIVTRGAQAVDAQTVDVALAPLWGLASVAAVEHPDLHCTCIDLARTAPPDELDVLMRELAVPNSENQVALRDGERYVARLIRPTQAHTPRPDGQPYQLSLPARGVLDNLSFTPLTRRAPGSGEVEIAVRATGLNFRDVLNVLGMYPGDPGAPGLECAGIVTAIGEGVTNVTVGQRVVAMGTNCFDSFVVVRAGLTAPLPATMSFAEAATIPTTFLTAAYGLQNLARLQPGERVLIHAAAGGVGLAAVQIALRAGAKVFATAGSPEKHAFLRAQGVTHIFSSRNLDFADAILNLTNGAGVDVVLNSLADDFITHSVRILAPQGRFLEIGKRGIWSHEQFAAERPKGEYYPFELGEVLRDHPGVLEHLLPELVNQCASAALQPLPIQAFPTGEIVQAFRFMAQARHIGKVVVTHRPVGFAVQADATYLITGGLGGLGLEVAQWLVAQGARHLALVGRRGPSPAAQATLDMLTQAGAEVRVLAADLGNAQEVTNMLATIGESQPPLRGIIHAAGVLDDGVLLQQRWERFAHVFAPKADAAWLLHQATRALPLDFFVLFSSAAALLGSAGQANYAAANAFLDALAQQRHAEGLPALSINWGAWSQVGMAAALDIREQRRIADRGLGSIDPASGLHALEALLEQDAPQVAVLPITWPNLLAQFPADNPPPLFGVLAREEQRNDVTTAAQRNRPAFGDAFAAAAPEERTGLIITELQQLVGDVLGIGQVDLPSPTQSLNDLGIDSLMAVELKNRVEGRLDVKVPVSVFLEGSTIALLAARLCTQMNETLREDDGSLKLSETNASELLANLDHISDSEVDALLTAMLMEQEESQ